MASPPYRSPATSPPYPAHMSLPNPKKRPSLSVSSLPPAAKRRKPTNVSQVSTPGTSHPLRQTSFPPEESAIERSPSVESDVTGVTGPQSALTAGGGKPKAKRGRRRKTEDASIVSGGKATAADGGSVTGQAADEGAEEDEDDAEGEDGVVGEKERREKEIEAADLAVLMENFTRDQMDRYESMRRHKLRKETVRKVATPKSSSAPSSSAPAMSRSNKQPPTSLPRHRHKNPNPKQQQQLQRPLLKQPFKLLPRPVFLHPKARSLRNRNNNFLKRSLLHLLPTTITTTAMTAKTSTVISIHPRKLITI
ncbi:MAG: hypothetical protein Q9167_007231 [Letrouitia subvulpina]